MGARLQILASELAQAVAPGIGVSELLRAAPRSLNRTPKAPSSRLSLWPDPERRASRIAQGDRFMIRGGRMDTTHTSPCMLTHPVARRAVCWSPASGVAAAVNASGC